MVAGFWTAPGAPPKSAARAVRARCPRPRGARLPPWLPSPSTGRPRMAERWRQVRRGPGYKVSSEGRVRSVDRTLADGRQAGGVMLAPVLNQDGYPQVTINGETVLVMHLVLEAFRSPRPYGMEACHAPESAGRQDSRLAVLRWDTHR